MKHMAQQQNFLVLVKSDQRNTDPLARDNQSYSPGQQPLERPATDKPRKPFFPGIGQLNIHNTVTMQLILGLSHQRTGSNIILSYNPTV